MADFTVPANLRVKLKENEKKKGNGDINCNWHAQYSHEMIGKKNGRLGNKWTSEDYPSNIII